MGKALETSSFYAALEAVGLGGKQISWGSDGQLNLGAELTDEERSKTLQAYFDYKTPVVVPIEEPSGD